MYVVACIRCVGRSFGCARVDLLEQMQGDNNSSSTSRGAYDSSYDASTSDRVPGPSRSRGPSLDPAVSRATSRSPRAGETPRTPRKNRSHGSTHTYGDRYVPYPHTSNYTRFIPSRDGTDIQAAFQLIPDQLLTPGGRHKRRTDPEIDAQTGTFLGSYLFQKRRMKPILSY